MMNKEELRKQCASLSNDDLIAIINNKIRYTELIVTAAQIEIDNRKLSKEEIKTYKRQQTRQSKIITGNIVDDITVIEKILFFLLFLPNFHSPVRRDFRRNNYVLKLRQAGYYSLVGFVFCTLTFSLGFHRIPLSAAISIWILSFLPAYTFDIYFYKQKTIRRLTRKSVDPEQAGMDKS